MNDEQDKITLLQSSVEKLLDHRGHLQMIMFWSEAVDLSDGEFGKMVRTYLKNCDRELRTG